MFSKLKLKKSKLQGARKRLHFQNAAICVLTALIPAMLILVSVQAKRFVQLEKEIRIIEEKQYEIINSNKQLVTGISILSNPSRIEQLATDVLDMRGAESGEIVRVDVKRQ